MKWEEVKNLGEKHYKSGLIEPVDLYKAGGMMQDFAVASIIKYAYRNREQNGNPISIKDMEKIKHYAEMLIALAQEEC